MMTKHDQASIVVGLFVFVITFIIGFLNRKSNWDTEFSRGLMRSRRVPRKPTTALHEFFNAVAAGAIMGLLVWWVES
jgi:hypothetical protein